MKKLFKITGISLLSLIALVVVIVAVVISIVFSPKQLTSLVNNKAAEYVPCTYQIGKIEPTLFSTFPQLGIEMDHVVLYADSARDESSAWLRLGRLSLRADMKEFLFHKKVRVSEILVDGLDLRLVADAEGHSMLDSFASEETTQADDTVSVALPFDSISVNRLELKDINLYYEDQASGLKAVVSQLGMLSSLQLNQNELSCLADLSAPEVSLSTHDTLLVDKVCLKVHLPVSGNLESMRFDLDRANLCVNDITANLDGWSELGDDIRMDMNFGLGAQTPLEAYVRLIPEAYASVLDGIDVSGKFSLDGRLSGCFSDTQLPKMEVQAGISSLDLTMESEESAPVTAQGDLKASLVLETDMETLEALDFEHMLLSSSFDLKNLSLNADSLSVSAPSFHLDFMLKNEDLPIQANISDCPSLKLDMGDTHVTLKSMQGSVLTSNPMKMLEDEHIFDEDVMFADSSIISDRFMQALPCMSLRLAFSNLVATVGDTLSASVLRPSLDMRLSRQANSSKGYKQFKFAYQCRSLQATAMNNSVQADTVGLSFSFKHNPTESNMLTKWSPKLSVTLTQALARLDGLEPALDVANLDFEYTNRLFNIRGADVKLGNSDFHLAGEVKNIGKYLDNTDNLIGDLNFVSNYCDLNELMSLVSGLGTEEADSEQEAASEASTSETDTIVEANPFLVPMGVDFVLNTDIRTADFYNQHLRNLGGMIYVRDGVMILEEVGFICEAAKLNLTAMYKSPRRNHLYLGLDYHMVDVHIDEIVNMLPQIDSLLPMLSSFRGNAEFHLAGETYLTADYQLKPSTMRGAMSLTGKDLVLLDGELFDNLSKILLFSKKTENKIDSINAEMTLFRKEIDVYPLQISMDKYRAIVGGRHNLDMSFDYHISLVEPLKIGVNVGGNIDKLKIVPAACQYSDQYKPTSKHVVEKQQLELRTMLREQLRKPVE